MKMKLAGPKKFLQLAAVLMVVGFHSVAQAAIVVQLEANDAGNKLLATTVGQCARQPNPNGCIRATGNVQINFSLAGNRQCSNGGSWQLDYVALGNGLNQTGNISATAEQDFDANQGSGIVNPVNSNDSHILIRDNNTQAYDVYYTVYASCTGNGAVINSDPRIENDGTGHP